MIAIMFFEKGVYIFIIEDMADLKAISNKSKSSTKILEG